MKKTGRYPIVTDDGSLSIFSETFGENYHSQSGAVQESFHIFICHGMKFKISSIYGTNIKISIFEMGFGTGLNALLTLCEAVRCQNEGIELYIEYHTIEKYPLVSDEYLMLDYREPLLSIYGDILDYDTVFREIHECRWNEAVKLSDNFSITKTEGDLGEGFSFKNMYDLVYFDAFSPSSQPELWSEEIFISLYQKINPHGVLVTYSSKGVVKQALREAGFQIERLPGPGSKRHILRAIKKLS